MNAKQPYRLISYSSADAAANMAIDEAILEAHLRGDVPPTLRIYQFAPPAVSFGYAQKTDSNIIDRIKKKNLAVVRRPTGGRAVLHMGDITYSFICSSKNAPKAEYALVGESIAVAYKQICQALVLTLKSLGVSAEIGKKNGNYQDKHDCFLATTPADLQYKGKKIAGSAQLRRRHAVLQHGSIILDQSQSSLPELLSDDVLPNADSDKNNSHHANLYEILGYKISLADLEKAFQYGFELAFENRFLAVELTSREQSQARQLQVEYGSFYG